MKYLLAPALALLAMASPAAACSHVTAQQVAFGISTCAACAAPVQQGFSAAYGDPGVAPVGLPVQTQTTTTTTQQVVQQPYTQVQQQTVYSQPQQVVVQAPVVTYAAAPVLFAAPVYAQTYGVGYGGFNTFGGSYGVRSFGGYNTFGNGFGGGYGGVGFNRGINVNVGIGHGFGGFNGGGIHHGGGFSAGFHGHR